MDDDEVLLHALDCLPKTPHQLLVRAPWQHLISVYGSTSLKSQEIKLQQQQAKWQSAKKNSQIIEVERVRKVTAAAAVALALALDRNASLGILALLGCQPSLLRDVGQQVLSLPWPVVTCALQRGSDVPCITQYQVSAS